MKKVLMFLVISAFILVNFSLSFADFANYAWPQLEYISNAVQILWNKPKAEVLRVMSIFPDFECTDYGDQLGCSSKFNTNNNNNIFVIFFMDDYEEHHDNLWKVSVTADVEVPEQFQSLWSVLWIDGMKPFHSPEDEFGFKGVVPLYFRNETTAMTAWFQPYKDDNGDFLLVEYYNGHVR